MWIYVEIANFMCDGFWSPFSREVLLALPTVLGSNSSQISHFEEAQTAKVGYQHLSASIEEQFRILEILDRELREPLSLQVTCRAFESLRKGQGQGSIAIAVLEIYCHGMGAATKIVQGWLYVDWSTLS